MLFSVDEQAIIAQCSPKGNGALALLCITGANSIEVANAICELASKKQLTDQKSHTIHYGRIVDQHNGTIDHVLFLLMRAPKTFTGQDTVEITCHNNPFIIQAIIERAIACGARLAQGGELSRRAVMNNKIDLTQAEAVKELVHANTQFSLKQSLSQLEGSLSQWMDSIEKGLINCMALCNASFEFLDEEELTFEPRIKEILQSTRAQIHKLKVDFDQQQQIRQGVRIALIGSVNAGKSSLFNALIGKDRAIVTNVPGTTRDVIEAGVYKNGNYWTLIDTAGIRKTRDTVEQEGITRSLKEAELADIILLVFDTSRESNPATQEFYHGITQRFKNKVISIANKVDVLKCVDSTLPEDALAVSVKNNTNIDRVLERIEDKIEKLFSQIEAPFLLNQRQYNLLLSLDKNIEQILSMLQPPVAHELVSYHLNDALKQLGEFTGRTIDEAAMDAVFREFCVGK